MNIFQKYSSRGFFVFLLFVCFHDFLLLGYILYHFFSPIQIIQGITSTVRRGGGEVPLTHLQIEMYGVVEIDKTPMFHTNCHLECVGRDRDVLFRKRHQLSYSISDERSRIVNNKDESKK